MNTAVFKLIVLTVALGAYCCLCGVESTPAEKALPPGFPSKELSGAVEQWKLVRAAERAVQPGAAGQVDLFWEILGLFEKNEDARADKNIETILEWLLFNSNLSMDASLQEPIYTKVPVYSPRLGARLLDKRLQTWIANSTNYANGTEPWLWPEYHGMSKKELAAGVKRLMETGPAHNPIARTLMAAAMLASEDPEGVKRFQEAIVDLKKKLPSQADIIVSQTITSLASGGVKDGLGLLLDLAEKEGEALPAETRERYGEARMPASLSRFYQIMQWNNPAQGTDWKEELARSRKWLKESGDKLEWNPARRKFVSTVPPPGMENIYKFGEPVEKSWGVSVLKQVAARAYGTILADLTDLMEKKPDAAKDAAVLELYIALFEAAGTSVVFGNERMLVLVRAPKANPELGARLWAVAARIQVKSQSGQTAQALEMLLNNVPEHDRKIREEGFAMLHAEYRAAFDEALKTRDDGKTAEAGFTYLLLGGKLQSAELKDFFARLPASWTTGGANGKFGQWQEKLLRFGRPAALRFMLLQALKDKDAPREQWMIHPLYRFGTTTGWLLPSEVTPGKPEELVPKYSAWLDEVENSLRWDDQRRRFVGAPLNEQSPVVHVADALAERYGLGTSLQSGNYDWPRKLLAEALGLIEKKPEAGKDPQIARLISGLVESAKLLQDQAQARKLLVALPKLNRELGLAVWARFLTSELQAMVKQPAAANPYNITHLDQIAPGHDPKIFAEACEQLAPVFKKQYEQAEKAHVDERFVLALICLYVRAELPAAALDQLGEEARKDGDTQRLRLLDWAEGLVRMGTISGLKVMLVLGKTSPTMRYSALQRFDYLAGLSNDQGGWRQPAANPAVLIEARMKWFSENEKNLLWDEGNLRFKSKPEAGRPADQPPAEAPAKPPKAPEEF